MSNLGPSSLPRTRQQKVPIDRNKRSHSSDSDSSSDSNSSAYSSSSADEEKTKKGKNIRRKNGKNTKEKYSQKNSSNKNSSDESDQHSSHEVMVTRSSMRNSKNKNSNYNENSINNNEKIKKRNWNSNDNDESENDSDYDSSSDDTDKEDYENYSEEESGPRIQQILGVNAESIDQDSNESKENEMVEDSEKYDTNTNLNDENIRYYVKWTNLSYIHCSWLTSKEILSIPGGDMALRKFKKKTSDDDLSRSTSIPSLLTASQDDLNANWFHVERIIGQKTEQEENNEDNHEPIIKEKYLVKWKSLPYDQCTWEDEEDITEKLFIEDYKKRQHHWNSTVYDKKEKEERKKSSKNYNENEEPNLNQSSSFVKITEPLSDKSGNVLRPYQLEGLNWLRFCWQNGNNSILADEMGLGKTVQIVSVLNDIATNHNITGPFIIIAPLTTLPQWKNEVERWSNLNAIIYQGSPATREIIEEYEFPAYDDDGNIIKNAVSFDALITNYETFATNFDKLKEIEWRYLVLDEGHRLKNHAGKCYQLLLNLTYEHCTLLTGTPIQNNVEELWSLLHLLHPHKFNDLPQFLEQFGNIDNVETLRNLQNLIRPYILRRKKNDVETSIAAKEETIIEVELTRIQKTYYRALLLDNTSTLLQQITGGSLPSLLNLMMQLRKVCNHPFLIKGAKENIEGQIAQKLPPNTSQDDIELEALIDSSGKMILIDKLLPKLKNDGHKVLIFSQMVKVLDIIEDYLIRKDYNFERIDGSVPEIEREAAIERFGSQEDIFIFLLCTKAGGVGINLTAADTVIIFDSDWNPQNDVQAQSRCHRIGQKREVKVYRLVTRGTYELQMLDRASKKLGLDHALLDGGELNHSHPMAAKEIEKLLRQGAYNITHDDDTEIDNFCAADIDQILERHSKKLSSNDNGKSLFNKAKFDPENDSLDMNAADFWLQVLPSVSSLNNDETSQKRRCRKDHPSHMNEQNSSSTDEISTQEKAPRVKKTSPVSIRATIKKLLSFGLGDSPYQRALLHQAACFMLDDLSEEDKNYLSQMLQLDNFTNPPEDIAKALVSFSSNLNDVRERKSSIVRRCILFYKLGELIKKLQADIDLWPPSDFSDPMLDYAILLGIGKDGIGDGSLLISTLQSLGLITSDDFEKLKNLREQEENQQDEDNSSQNNNNNDNDENNNNNENDDNENDDNDENSESTENDNDNAHKTKQSKSNRELIKTYIDFSLDQLHEGIVDNSTFEELGQYSLKALEKKIVNLVDTLMFQLKDVQIDESENQIEIQNPIEWKKNHSKLYNRNELNREEYQSLFATISLFGLPRRREFYLKNTNQKSINQIMQKEDENKESSFEDNNNNNSQFFKNNIYLNCEEVDWMKVLHFSKLKCVSVEAIAKAGFEIAMFADEEEMTLFDVPSSTAATTDGNENDKDNENDNENENENENDNDKKMKKKKIKIEKGDKKMFSKEEIQEKASRIMPIISKLGSYGTRPWQRKVRNSIRDIEKVRTFAPTFDNASDMGFLRRVKKFDAIDWWEAKHDIALISAIYEYGQLMVTTWVVDEKGPFREHIESDLLEDFEKAAENEKQKGRPCKPKDLGDMAFIFKDKLRMNRALLVVRFIESHRERYLEKQMGISTKNQKQSSMNEIENNNNNNNNNQNSLIYAENIDDQKNLILPKLPINVNPNLVLMNLGKFLSWDSMYPNGYTVRRKYFSTQVQLVGDDPNPNNIEQIWYEESVNFDSTKIVFEVKMLSPPSCVFTSHSPDAAWMHINSLIEIGYENKLKQIGMQMNMQQPMQIQLQMPMQVPMAVQINERLNYFKNLLKMQLIDGEKLFGFSDPFIVDCFRKMKASMHRVVPVPKIMNLAPHPLQMPIIQPMQQMFNHQQYPTVQIDKSVLNHPSEKVHYRHQYPIPINQQKTVVNNFQQIQPPFQVKYPTVSGYIENNQQKLKVMNEKVPINNFQKGNENEVNFFNQSSQLPVTVKKEPFQPQITRKVTTKRIQIAQQVTKNINQNANEKPAIKIEMLLNADTNIND